MTPLIITILVLNLLMFAVDMQHDWNETKHQRKTVLAISFIVYLWIGFLSPVVRIYYYIKENGK